MAKGEYDFTYKNDEWAYPSGYISQELTLHLERWSDGQIHLQSAEDATGFVVTGWLDEAIREWVQAHQHKLTDTCFDQIEDSMDLFADRVDYFMEQGR